MAKVRRELSPVEAGRFFVYGSHDADKVPKAIQRGLRYLAGYFWMNRNASFEDTRVTAIDRKIVFGLEAIAGRYRFMNDLVGG